MASWKFVLADRNGTTLTELPTASGRTLTFRRNAPAEVQFTIGHADDAAYLLLDALANSGVPTLRCYRDGVLRFNGYLAPFTEEAGDSTTLTATFRGPFARLLGDGSDRGRFTSEYEPYIADAGEIAKQLIDATNAVSFTGLATTGTIEATKTRERTYEYANIGEAIVDLSQMFDGFDFEEIYEDGGAWLARFYIYAKQGIEQTTAKFEYGPGTLANVREVGRQTQPPANIVTVLGANGLFSVKTDEVSRAKYGDWPMQVSATDVDEQAVLDDKALGLLRPKPVKTMTFVPEAGLAPNPWDYFWLGDSVPLYVRRDAFVEDVMVRVNGITVVVDENGDEATEVADPTTPGEEAEIRAGLEVEVL